jgi:integrase
MLRAGRQPGEREDLSVYMGREFPVLMKALRFIDVAYSGPKPRSGFNLVKRENKKRGFLFYVRYLHGGKLLPSKWNTHTNIREEAERFARENRDRLIGQYLLNHNGHGFGVFDRFYKEQSEYLTCEEKRTRPISGTTRRNYHSVITRKFVPFLKNLRISCPEQISVKVLSDFQDHYLSLGIQPQTVNDYFKAVKRIFSYMVRKGHIHENPCDIIKNIPVHQQNKKERGCYNLDHVKGVFDKRWTDRKNMLLCLLIYTTGMRNGEIAKFCMGDIITREGCRFIDVRQSKTVNGVRLVPLHERVYRKLKNYAKGKGPQERIFRNCSSVIFSAANAELARILKAEEAAVRENITFYSGRHFWKTLMNAEGLGEEVEEVFMGHKVSNDVAKLYNHRDKQGKKMMAKKAKQVFSILDKRLFSGRPKNKPG